MRNLILIVLLLFMPFWCGCVRYTYEQYQVKVVDAEQGIPVEGAKVFATYVAMMAPPPKKAMTNQSGLAELKVAKGLRWGIYVTAAGYTTYDLSPLRDNMSEQQGLFVQNDNEVKVSIYKKTELKN